MVAVEGVLRVVRVVLRLEFPQANPGGITVGSAVSVDVRPRTAHPGSWLLRRERVLDALRSERRIAAERH